MGAHAFCGLAADKRWNVKCFALVVCVIVSKAAETMGQKEAGDACVSVSGKQGTCQDVYSCPSVASPPSRQDTCGFRGLTPIICCQGEPSVPLDTGLRLSQQRAARQTEGPWWQQSRQPFTTRKTANNNWWRPQSDGNEAVPNIRWPSTSTRQTTQQRPWPQSTSSRRIQPYQLRRPHSGSISSDKCHEYSRAVQPIVEALPLLPYSETIKVQVEKCKFNQLELIVGGTNASVGEYPHMAALGYQTAGRKGAIEFLCGGSLISDFFVLTAAHCDTLKDPKLTMVRLGELNLKSDFDGATPADYPVAEVIRHPEYKHPAHYNDIALIRLGQQVQFNENIRPACLYTRSTFDVNKAIATGWGQIAFTGDKSDVLLKVAIDIVPNAVCNREYQVLTANSNKLTEGIVPSMMCAGEANGGKDTCLGDSGGPLQISNENNQCVHYLVGVTSFGMSCAAKNSAGIYTRVSVFVPWIEDIVWPSG